MSCRKVVQIAIYSLLVCVALVSNFVRAETQFDSFDNWMTANMKTNHVSGVSLAIIDNGQVVYAKTYSTLASVNANVDSYFQAADLTQVILTVPILQLAHEGKLSMSDKLSKFGINSPLTVQDFLTLDDHTQPRYTFMRALMPAVPSLAAIMKTKPTKIDNLTYPVDRLMPLTAISQNPLRTYQDLIQATTKRPLEEYMNTSVFEPLRMKRSMMMMQSPIGIDDKKDENNANAYISLGGMWTTATDVSKFLQVVMSTPRLQSGFDDLMKKGYGLSFERDRCRSAVKHYQKLTHAAGVNNYVLLFPESKQGIVILTNATRSGKLLSDITAEIATQYHWPFKPTISDDYDQRGALPYCKEAFKPNYLLPPLSFPNKEEIAQVAPETAPAAALVSAPVVIPNVSSAELKSCESKVKAVCHNKNGLGFHHCAINTLANVPGCSLAQRILKESGGMPTAIAQYHQMHVVRVVVNSAENQIEYFVLTPSLELISLTQAVTGINDPVYTGLIKSNPRLTLLPIADGFPKETILANGHTQLLFPQRLTSGCYDCAPLAHAWIGYEFNEQGTLLQAKMMKVT